MRFDFLDGTCSLILIIVVPFHLGSQVKELYFEHPSHLGSQIPSSRPYNFGQIGGNCEGMATQEDIRESKGEIRKLSVVIEGLETQLKETTDKEEKLSLDVQISDKTKLLIAKQETLTALISSQQGKSSRISVVPSQSSRCNPLPDLFRHLFITHSGSATEEGKM